MTSSPLKSFEQINIGPLQRSTCNKKPPMLLDHYVANLEEDLTYHEVQHDLNWRLAMDDKMTNITKMKTWTFVPLPQGKKAIICRWIYKKKLGINGVVEHYKPDQLQKDANKKVGIDFEETFALVAKWNTLEEKHVFSSSLCN
jgi:hypothetical protein